MCMCARERKNRFRFSLISDCSMHKLYCDAYVFVIAVRKNYVHVICNIIILVIIDKSVRIKYSKSVNLFQTHILNNS